MVFLAICALFPLACGGGGGGGGSNDTGGPVTNPGTDWLVIGTRSDFESGDPFVLDRANLSTPNDVPTLRYVENGNETVLVGTHTGDQWTFTDTSTNPDTSLVFDLQSSTTGTLTIDDGGGAPTQFELRRLEPAAQDQSGLYRITIANPEEASDLPTAPFYRTLVQEPGDPTRVTLVDDQGDFHGFAAGSRYYLTRTVTPDSPDEEDPNVALLIELDFSTGTSADGTIEEVRWAGMGDANPDNDFRETAQADLAFDAAEFAGQWLLVGFDLNDLQNDDEVAIIHPVVFTRNGDQVVLDLGGGTTFDGTADGLDWTFNGTQDGADIEVLTHFTNEAVGALRFIRTDPGADPVYFDAELYRIVPTPEDLDGTWTVTYDNPRGTNPDFPTSMTLALVQADGTPAELTATSSDGGSYTGYATANFYFLARRDYAATPSQSNPNRAELFRISMEGPNAGAGTIDIVRWAEPDFKEASGADVTLTR